MVFHISFILAAHNVFHRFQKTESVFHVRQKVTVFYGRRVMIIWDRLSSHLSARQFFESQHPDWFLFEELPSCSPELNPVEQC